MTVESQKIFIRRRNIERATRFKVEYLCYLNDDKIIEFREFNSAKSLNQWENRTDNDSTFGIMILRKLALIDDIWEPYATIGKKTLTLGDLKKIVYDLETTI